MDNSCRPNQIIAALLLVLLIMFANFPSRVRAGCDPAAVWLTLPDSSQVVDVNKQLMTDSGPSVNRKAQTTTYSRRWQGAQFSRSLSITIIIYPTVKMAADSVKSYGKALLKGNEGQEVSLGDLGYRTNQIKRPYFMVHKGRFVVSYYTSYPGRRSGSGKLPSIPAQEKTIQEILYKITQLPCFAATIQTTSPPNECPKVTLSVSPTKLLPTETVKLVANATDADGDKLTYSWEILDFNHKKIMVNWVGPLHTWQPPGPGQYFVSVDVSDAQCCGNSNTHTIIVTAAPNLANRPPIIRLTVKPNPAMVDQKILFTAAVSDPDGDSLGQQDWFIEFLQTGGRERTSMTQGKRVGNKFSYHRKFTADGQGIVTFEVGDIRGASSIKSVKFVVMPPTNQLLSVHLISSHPLDHHSCQINEGGKITFTAIVNNPKQEPLTYAWSINGKQRKDWRGPKAAWGNISYKWQDCRIKVQVWKKNGETASDTITLSVLKAQTPPPPQTKNSKPKVSLLCLTANPKTGKPVRFKATVSDPDAGDKLTKKWSLDGKTVGWSGLTPSWNNSTAGKHSVTILVSDGTDKVSATKTFTVQDPPSPLPPPPISATIIKSAEFVDSATSSVWGSNPKNQWQTGEEINLRIDIKPVRRSHSLEIIWHDANGKVQKRTLTTVSTSSTWSPGETIWSSLRSSAHDATGTWTVEILVDGQLDQTLAFRLNLMKRSISPRRPSPPSQQPRNRPNRPAPSTQGTGSGGGTPNPPSTWKSVL